MCSTKNIGVTMFQVKINIYKLIKMLAKIKHDEDVYKRPFDSESDWYKLSRNRVDYRQVLFDRFNRYRPGLVYQLTRKPPEFTSDLNARPSNGGRGIQLPENNKYITSRQYTTNYPAYQNSDFLDWVRRNRTSSEFWEDDIAFAWAYANHNFWWFDTLLAPIRYTLLMSSDSAAIGNEAGYVLDFNPFRNTDEVSQSFNDMYKYSPNRDLATNVMLWFASIQEYPQDFISKMSHVTAPYMRYVETSVLFLPPISKDVYFIGNPIDRTGTHANIYGVGEILEVFNQTAPSALDRDNRRKLFKTYFDSLDSANWLEADKMADELIKLTTADGWAPYIGYGDLSLFIQKMNIPSEYIMTHALTDYQDEILTNAYALNRLNTEIADTVYKMQSDISNANDLITLDPSILTEQGYVMNSTPHIIMDSAIDSILELRNAISMHVGVGGEISDIQKVLDSTPTMNDAIDILSAKATEVAIDEQLKTIDKITRNG